MTRTILLTGATSGLGLALARLYAARGERLVLVGRRKRSELDPALFTPERYVEVDLRRRDCGLLVGRALAERGIDRLDVAVMNAGVGYYGAVTDQSMDAIDELLATNLYAPIVLAHALIPWLRRGRGMLSFVSSLAAIMPAPEYAIYAASKAALDGFARSLAVEVRPQIAIQVIHPGPIKTAMHERSGAPLDKLGWQRFPPAERVASRVAAAIDGGKAQVTIGRLNRALRIAGILAPRLIERGALRRVQPIHARLLPTQQEHLPRCFITGAADGIGRALVERFAAAGYAVVGYDRDWSRGEEVRASLAAVGNQVDMFYGDLSDPGDLQRLVERLGQELPFDVAIHCAGISAVGRFERTDLQKQLAVLDVNLRAPLALTAAMLREHQLVSRHTLVFLASLSVFTSYPGASVYAASKDGIASFARSLGVAFESTGSHVLTVFPGPTRTAHARRYSPDNRRENRRMPPEVLANAIYTAIVDRKRRLIPGAANQAAAWMGRLAPGLSEAIMRGAILEKLEQS